MKKLSKERKALLLSLAKHKFVHQLNRRYAHKSVLSKVGQKKRRPNDSTLNPWVAPEVFALGKKTERRLFLNALKRLRTRVLAGEKRIVMDFSAAHTMRAEGTLLFVAELRTLVRAREGGIEWELIPARSDKVMQVLQQVKVLDILGFQYRIECKDEDVVHWLCAFGQGADGSKFDDVMGPYQGDIAEALSADLYKGVSEAMTNVVNHAYSLPREDGLRPISDCDWWMFSTQNDGRLTVVICDLGAGIPATLPHNRKHRTLWKRIRRLSNRTDGKTIAYVVDNSVSRTERSHRGKGLGQISRAIQHIDDAKVTIMSNRGVYRRTSAGEVKIWDYADSIQGTIIFWQIPLRQDIAS